MHLFFVSIYWRHQRNVVHIGILRRGWTDRCHKKMQIFLVAWPTGNLRMHRLAACAFIHLCVDTWNLWRWWYQLCQRKAWSRYSGHTILPSCNHALNIASILLKLNMKWSHCRNSSLHDTFFWAWSEHYSNLSGFGFLSFFSIKKQ